MSTGPCQPWPLDPTCAHGIPADPLERSAEQAAAVLAATELLWRLTAGVFGACEHTVRPAHIGCPAGGFPPRGIPPDGVPVDVATGTPTTTGGCGCQRSCEVALPGPVQSVTRVEIDGQVLDPAAYRVDNMSLLVRVDGACWPCCQAMGLPLGEPNTWAVTYTYGNQVPPLGRRAVAAVAAELLRSCTPGAQCKLPANTVQVTREGVTVAMDTTGLLDAGRTGVPEADMWLASVNPHNRRSRSAVYSPDMPRFRETTYPVPATCPPGGALVDLRPRVVAIAGYAGDTLRVHVTLDDPAAYVGALWAAQVRDGDGALMGTFTVVPDATGAMLTLDAATTAVMGGGFVGVWDVEVTDPSAGKRTLVRGPLTLAADVTQVVGP